jgi:dTDP-4-dehydrorhamnose 3,5-epimerase
MKYIKTPIEGLFEMKPQVFGDERGYFFESFKSDEFKEIVADVDFVQDNQSSSTKGVLRGLHFQKGDFEQGKLVRVITGKILDVAVDLRPNSATFGEHYSVILDSEKQNMFYVPEGFAHGFYVIEDAVFTYKCTNYYNKSAEGSLVWNDKDLNIQWNAATPSLSEKDENAATFSAFKTSIGK